MVCSEGYSPVNMEAWEGTVHWAGAIAVSKRVAVAANLSKFGVVGRS
jgi:hypothetical protein